MSFHRINVCPSSHHHHVQRVNHLLRCGISTTFVAKPRHNSHNKQQCYIARLVQYAPNALHTSECSLQFSHALIPSINRQEAFPRNMAISSPGNNILQNYTNAKYIVAHICLCHRSLFRRHIAVCACRLLEYGITVAVGKSEVNNLQRSAISRNHNVGRLEVAMRNAARVNIAHCFKKL